MNLKKAVNAFRTKMTGFAVMTFLWVALISLSMVWNVLDFKHETLSNATAAARANLNKDLTFRRWATSHGGVYVPLTGHTPANPLLNLPNREVVLPDGRVYTLMNPAYILRQIYEDYIEEFGIESHITSLKTINPNNKPAQWEVEALKSFERGEKEYLEVAQIDGKPWLRLMRPLITEPGCLKCHAFQGYKVGDIRGGISNTVSLASFQAHESEHMLELALTHLMIWLTGFLGLVVWNLRNRKLLQERQKAEDDLKLSHTQIGLLNEALEARVKKRTRELEEVNQELEAFSYSVSHDLRTPLRAIDGFSQIVLDKYGDKLDDEGRRLLNVVRTNTIRMSTLIDDILHFSRTGRAEMSFYEVNIRGVIEDILERLKPEPGKVPVEFKIKPLPDVACDRALIQQVFENLILNAIKFSSKEKKPQVEIGGQVQGLVNMYYVKDNGVGFDMAYVNKLFGVFQRLHKVEEFEGTGIGLAIVKRIINRHGGQVWAESQPGKGATFYFNLPNVKVSDEPAVKDEK